MDHKYLNNLESVIAIKNKLTTTKKSRTLTPPPSKKKKERK
jgi:hypothetical protein